MAEPRSASVQARQRSRWERFWASGGLRRALLFAVLYMALYLGVGQLVGQVFPDDVSGAGSLDSAAPVFYALVLPVLVMAVALLLFLSSVGWHREVFGRQPVAGKKWMWIAVVLVLTPIVLHVVATDWRSYSVPVISAVLLFGLGVGFVEEVLCRGVAVVMLRRAGYGERAVMVLSSLVFALLHTTNILAGQPVAVVGMTVIYTFGFGVMMYLSMRVTGSIIPAIALHAATDPTTMLATGGVDTHGLHEGTESLLQIAGLFNLVFILAGFIAIFLVKGQDRQEPSGEVLRSSDT